MTNELKHVTELLTTGTGTEGSLLVPKKIYETLVDEAKKFLIPAELAAIRLGPAQIPGSSVDINLVTPNSMAVRKIGEGAELGLDQPAYTSINLKPDKYGVGIRITTEMLEDAQWNLLQHSIMIAGRRFAENENSITISQSLDGAGNTVAGGAAVTIANITRAMQYLEDSDYAPTDFLVGMEVLNDLRNIDTFVEYQKVGNTEMLNRGFLGTIYGMNVVRVSTNAGMTATTSFVIDRAHAYVAAEKRGITVENFKLPEFDMSAASITQRIVTKTLRASAIAKITSS